MLIYAPTITPRLQYIAGFIGQEWGMQATLTSDTDELDRHPGIKINYSAAPLVSSSFWIRPIGLLEESEIRPLSIHFKEWNGLPVFFPSEADIPFDLFSAVFYLLSRYEEYLPHEKDSYGRYAHTNSLAFNHGFLQQPLVNQWLAQWKHLVQKKWPEIHFPAREFRFLPTYDIDEAWSFRYKEWSRSSGGALKDLLKGNWKRFRQRRRVLNRQEPDPFDAYAWMDDLHRPHHFRPRYFLLIHEKTGRYDRNILPVQTAFQTLCQQLASKYDIGLHPSWQSGDDETLLKKEKDMLEKITQSKITASRQHFIRFTLPHTFRLLTEAGIREDYSMGYGSINGFRASVASPFYWYDLEKEQTSYLLLFPFCFMEANAFYEQKMEPAAAAAELNHYLTVIKAVNGLMITIWHNTFLGTDEKFRGWREVYQQFIASFG